MDHHVEAVVEQLQVGIRHHHRDLDEGVVGQIQPGHLTVDPDQKITHVDSLVRVRAFTWRPVPGHDGESPPIAVVAKPGDQETRADRVAGIRLAPTWERA
ncbi:hypothetical protein GCM10009835_42330 [Planosporangium flavigriseum]|uniref:Uncharacterized protein n=1 Tax=Planosporangium flavigriseum TaxID=373681 RepID=A0A8J3PML8_9ACTN|nr:hypothetical protein Pfl04_24020 [Planosporangium flavigriseum]